MATANWFAWNFPLLCLVFYSANVRQGVGFRESISLLASRASQMDHIVLLNTK